MNEVGGTENLSGIAKVVNPRSDENNVKSAKTVLILGGDGYLGWPTAIFQRVPHGLWNLRAIDAALGALDCRLPCGRRLSRHPLSVTAPLSIFVLLSG